MIPSETATKFQQEREQEIAAIGQQHVPTTRQNRRQREEEEERPHTLSGQPEDRMINRFSQYLSRDHENFSNIVPSIPPDNGISILPTDKRSISLGPIDPAGFTV